MKRMTLASTVPRSVVAQTTTLEDGIDTAAKGATSRAQSETASYDTVKPGISNA